jgi:hypothetical protein
MWPDMEKKLYTEFIQRRAEGSIVHRSWFRRRSRKLWNQTYSSYDRIALLFVFSNSWFQDFCRRFNITLRAVTRQVRALLYINSFTCSTFTNISRHQSFQMNMIILCFPGFDIFAAILSLPIPKLQFWKIHLIALNLPEL